MSGLLHAKATPVMTVATAEMTSPMIDRAAQATIQAVRDGNIEQVSEQLKGNEQLSGMVLALVDVCCELRWTITV